MVAPPTSERWAACLPRPLITCGPLNTQRSVPVASGVDSVKTCARSVSITCFCSVQLSSDPLCNAHPNQRLTQRAAHAQGSRASAIATRHPFIPQLFYSCPCCCVRLVVVSPCRCSCLFPMCLLSHCISSSHLVTQHLCCTLHTRSAHAPMYAPRCAPSFQLESPLPRFPNAPAAWTNGRTRLGGWVGG